MDLNYIKDLYDSKGGKDVFGDFNDFVDAISKDDKYRSDVFSNLGGENTFGAFKDFDELVKKKDGTSSDSESDTQKSSGGFTGVTNEVATSTSGFGVFGSNDWLNNFVLNPESRLNRRQKNEFQDSLRSLNYFVKIPDQNEKNAIAQSIIDRPQSDRDMLIDNIYEMYDSYYSLYKGEINTMKPSKYSYAAANVLKYNQFITDEAKEYWASKDDDKKRAIRNKYAEDIMNDELSKTNVEQFVDSEIANKNPVAIMEYIDSVANKIFDRYDNLKYGGGEESPDGTPKKSFGYYFNKAGKYVRPGADEPLEMLYGRNEVLYNQAKDLAKTAAGVAFSPMYSYSSEDGMQNLTGELMTYIDNKGDKKNLFDDIGEKRSSAMRFYADAEPEKFIRYKNLFGKLGTKEEESKLSDDEKEVLHEMYYDLDTKGSAINNSYINKRIGEIMLEREALSLNVRASDPDYEQKVSTLNNYDAALNVLGNDLKKAQVDWTRYKDKIDIQNEMMFRDLTGDDNKITGQRLVQSAWYTLKDMWNGISDYFSGVSDEEVILKNKAAAERSLNMYGGQGNQLFQNKYITKISEQHNAALKNIFDSDESYEDKLKAFGTYLEKNPSAVYTEVNDNAGGFNPSFGAVLNTMSETSGQIIAQMLPALATQGIASRVFPFVSPSTTAAVTRAGATGFDAAAEVIASSSVSGLSNAINAIPRFAIKYTTIVGAGFAQSYENAYLQAINDGKSKEDAEEYATKIGLVNGLSEVISPDVDMVKSIAKGGKGIIRNIANGIDDNIIGTAKNIKNVIQKAAINYGKGYINTAPKEVFEEVVAAIGEHNVDKEYGLNQSDVNYTLMNRIRNAAVQTSLGMLGMPVGGVMKNIQSPSNLQRESIYYAAMRPAQVNAQIDSDVTNGLINSDEGSRRKQIVATAAKVGNNIPLKMNGREMTTNEKAEFITKRVQLARVENALENNANVDNGLTEKDLTKTGNRLKADIYNIRSGKYFGMIATAKRNLQRAIALSEDDTKVQNFDKVIEPTITPQQPLINIKSGDTISMPNNERATVLSVGDEGVNIQIGNDTDNVVSYKNLTDFDNAFTTAFFQNKKQFADMNPTIHADPAKYKRKQLNQFNPEIERIANAYAKRYNVAERVNPAAVTDVNNDRSVRIAKAYENMKHDPTNPEVVSAYNALKKETKQQWDDIRDAGYKIELWTGQGEPYLSSKEMSEDVAKNKHLWVLPTVNEFGSNDDFDSSNNPLLENTGVTSNDIELTYNDMFRGVHDFFGHAHIDNQFGVVGEENAWRLHSQMFSPLARKAMTTETRGQNSWVNYSGVNDKAKAMLREATNLERESKDADGKIIDRKKYEQAIKMKKEGQLRFRYADQKVGLLPDEFNELSDVSDEVQEGLGKKSTISNYKAGDTVLLSDLKNEWPVTNEGLIPLFDWGAKQNVKIGFRDRDKNEGIAYYNYVNDEIFFNVNHPAFKNLTVQDVQEFIAHELIHKAAHASFKNNIELRKGYQQEANKVIDFLRQQDLSKLSEETRYYANFIVNKNASPQELITYAMTNQNIANWFASLEYNFGEKEGGEKSIWQWMKDKILRFVSNIINSKSVLDEASRLMDKYINLDSSSNNNEQQEKDDLYQSIMDKVHKMDSTPIKTGMEQGSVDEAIDFVYEQAVGIDPSEDRNPYTDKVFGKDLVDKVIDFKQRELQANVTAQVFAKQEGKDGKPARAEGESAFDYAKRVKEWYDNIRTSEETAAKEKRQALIDSREERSYIKFLNEGVKILRSNMGVSREDFNKELGLDKEDYETYIASLQMFTERREQNSSNKIARKVLQNLRQQNPKKVANAEISLMRKQWKSYKFGYQKGYVIATQKAQAAFVDFKKAQAEKNKEKMAAAKAKYDAALQQQKDAKQEILDRQKYFRDKISQMLDDVVRDESLRGAQFNDKDVIRLAKAVTNVVSEKTFDRLNKVVEGLIDKADYLNKVSDISTWKKQLQKLMKSGTLTGNDLAILKSLNSLNPTNVSDVDTLHSIYSQIIENRKNFNPAQRNNEYTNEGIQAYVEKEQAYDIDQRVDAVAERYNELLNSIEFINLNSLALTEGFNDELIGDMAKGVRSAPDKLKTYKEKVAELNKIEDAVRSAENKLSDAIDNERLDSNNPADIISMDSIVEEAMKEKDDNDRSSNRLVLEEQAVANQQVIDLGDASLNEDQRRMLRIMKEVDVSNWDADTLRLFMNTVQNIYDNSDNIGYGIFLSKYEAQAGDEMKKWVELIDGQEYKVRDAKFKFNWVKINASVDNFIARLANNSKTLRSRFVGVTRFGKIRDKATQAMAQHHALLDSKLASILREEKISIDDVDPQVRLSLYSWLLQNKDGSLLENNAELKRRIGEIVNDIQVKEKAGEADKKEAAIERKIFYEMVDKINKSAGVELVTKNSKGVEIVNDQAVQQITIDDIKKAELINSGEQKIYDLFRSVYDKIQPDFTDKIRMYQNKELVLWNNYMKDSFRNLNGNYITGNFSNPSDGSYFASSNAVNMTADSALDRVKGNRITALDEQLEKLTGEKVSRGINLNFFKNQSDNVSAMLMDVNTLEDRSIAEQVFNNNNFIATAGGIDNVNLAKEFMVRELRNMMGIKTEKVSDAVSFFNRIVRPFSKVAVHMQLADAGQYIKQASSQLLGNAFVDLTLKGAGTYPIQAAVARRNNQDIRTLIAKSLIAQRGETRGGTNIYGDKNVGELNERVKNKSTYSKVRDKFLQSIRKQDKYTGEEKQWATWFLQAGDVMGAEVSWVAYYAHNLVSNGMYDSFNKIDWAKEAENPNPDASAYAQDAVANMQNVTSSASASSFISDKNANVARALFGAFGSFAMNKFEVYYQTLRVLLNKGGAITNKEQRSEELKEAGQRFVAAAAEDIFYGFAVKMAFYLGKTALTDLIVGMIGIDDDEESKKKKSKKKGNGFQDKVKQLAWAWAANTAFSWTTSTGQDIIQSTINDVIKTRGGEPVFFEQDGRNLGTVTAATQNFWKDMKRVYQTTIGHREDATSKDRMVAFVTLLSNIAQASDMNFADFNRVVHKVAERYDKAVLQDELGLDRDLNEKKDGTEKIKVSGFDVEFTGDEKELYNKSRREFLEKIPKEYRDIETYKRNASEYAKGMVLSKYGKEITRRITEENKK